MGCLAMTEPTDGKWRRFDWLNAMYDAELSPIAKTAAAFLFSKADTSADAWPSIRTIAEKTGRSQNSIRKALDELETAGWLTRKRRDHARGWGYVFTLQKPTPSLVEPLQPVQVTPSATEGDPFSQCRSPLQPLKGTPSATEGKQTKEQTKEQKKTRDSDFKGFESWVEEQVEKAGRKPLPFGTVQTLVLRLAEYSRDEAETYVLEALGNMADAENNAFCRAIVKPENIQRYIRPSASASGNDRIMTADEWDELEFS